MKGDTDPVHEPKPKPDQVYMIRAADLGKLSKDLQEGVRADIDNMADAEESLRSLRQKLSVLATGVGEGKVPTDEHLFALCEHAMTFFVSMGKLEVNVIAELNVLLVLSNLKARPAVPDPRGK